MVSTGECEAFTESNHEAFPRHFGCGHRLRCT